MYTYLHGTAIDGPAGEPSRSVAIEAGCWSYADAANLYSQLIDSRHEGFIMVAPNVSVGRWGERVCPTTLSPLRLSIALCAMPKS